MKDKELDDLLKLSDVDSVLNGFPVCILENLLDDMVSKEKYEIAVVIRDHLQRRSGKEYPNA